MELELTANLKPKTSIMAADKKVAHRPCKVTFDDNPLQIGDFEDLSRAGSFCDDCPADIEDEKMGMQALTWSSDSVSYSKLPCVVINVESLDTIPEANSSFISEVLIVDPNPDIVSTPPPVESASCDILSACKNIEVTMSMPSPAPSINNAYPFLNCYCGCDCPSTHSVGMETKKMETINKKTSYDSKKEEPINKATSYDFKKAETINTATSYDLKISCLAKVCHPNTTCQAKVCNPNTTCHATVCKPSTTCKATACHPNTTCQATVCGPRNTCERTVCTPRADNKCKATRCAPVTACQATCCDSDTCLATDDDYDSETQNEAIDSDPSEPDITDAANIQLKLRKVSYVALSNNELSPCMHVVDLPNVVTVVINNTSSPSTSCSYIANSQFFSDEKDLLHDADRSMKIKKMLMKQQQLIALEDKEKQSKNNALKNYVLAPIRKLQKLADWASS